MSEDLLVKLEKKRLLARNLLAYLTTISRSVPGVGKLEKNIEKELKFLEKVNGGLKEIHVNSSNINHFAAMVECLKGRSDVVAVLQPFLLRKGATIKKKVYVDFVCQDRLLWIKVIARNPMSMSLVSTGNCQFGQRSILNQAHDYLETSYQHKHMYTLPKVLFHFASGIESNLANMLIKIGIEVSGDILEDVTGTSAAPHDLNSSDSADEELSDFKDGMEMPNQHDHDSMVITNVNLDVTAMIGYVSLLTNDNTFYDYPNNILNQQAAWEREAPLKPVLDQLFEGKELICCKSAASAFDSIVMTLGGPEEKRRATELMDRVRIVDDTSKPITLKLNQKVKERSAIVFMTGEEHHAITVTANEGFVRSAANQGQQFTVFVHQSRALTESKCLEIGQLPEA